MQAKWTEMIKRYKKECFFLILFMFVNILMLLSLPAGNPEPVFGIVSRKIRLFLTLCADMLILSICAAYRQFIAKKRRLRETVVLVLLSPVIGFLTLELMTGNLFGLPVMAIEINLIIAYLLLFLFLVFFCSIRLTLMCYNLCMPLLGVVQYYVYKFRGRSFMLSDLSSIRTAMQVAGGYSYTVELVAGMGMLIAVGWLYLVSLTPERKLRRFPLLRKAAVLVLCVLSLNLLKNRSFAAKHTVLQMDMWNTEKDYRMKGYMLGLLSQIQYLEVEEPENYTIENVFAIAEKYRASYDTRQENNAKVDGKPKTEQPVNLLIIMNESWADFRLLENGKSLESFTPFIDQMNENVTKGWIEVPAFGGGTASTEYEMLTGNCVDLLEANPPIAYQVHSQKDEYGVASTLRSQGYGAIALHPHSALNYNRRQVYPRMGFEEFIAKENWPEKFSRKTRKFINDQACYDFLTEIFQKKAAGEKLFAFLVTMQNHAGFSVKKYNSTVNLDYTQDYPEAEQYFSLLRESDAAFENLVQHFERVKEPTMIVMFGDHWPNLQDGFYDALMENGMSSMTTEENRKRFMTPFVMWTNYERDVETDVLMSASYFGSYILEQAGEELTDYNKFLLEMREQMPVISGTEVLTADGEWYQKEELQEKLAGMLNEYEIIEYNNMFAKGKKVKSVFTISDNS